MSNTKTIKPELADAAAEWWTDKLRGDVKQDNGDAFGSALGTVTRKKIHGEDGIDEDKLDTFEELLADRLTTEERGGKNLFVGVDYGPGAILAEPAEAAGIDVGMSTFPWKTSMWIEAERILVSEGHRSDREDIYSTDAWPPTVLEIKAEDVELNVTLSKGYVEDGDLSAAIETYIAPRPYEGYDHTIRSLDDIHIIDVETTENEHGQECFQVEVSCSSTVFVSEEYVERVQRQEQFGIEDRVKEYITGQNSVEVTDDLCRNFVRDAFEVYEHLDANVTAVVLSEYYRIEAW